MRLPIANSAIVVLFLIAPVTSQEQPAETISLFDGETLNGWVTADGKPVTKGWIVQDGAIHRQERGGDIFYEHEVGDFELSFEWKIAPRGNSGVKYKVRRYDGRLLGCEFQLLDDGGKNFGKGSTGALYALYQTRENKQVNPAGDWNTAKIVVRGDRIEHWLNGEKIVEAAVGSDDWHERLKKSKFSSHEDFAQNKKGRIMLQDHGGKVWFRNLVLVPFE